MFGNNQIKLKEVEGQKSKENKSYFAGSITKIINNVQLNIRNVHIIYQATDNFGVPFLLGISFDSLAIQAANDDWQPGFVNGSNSMKKLITLTNFSVYWKKDEKISFVDNQQLAEDISVFSYSLVSLNEQCINPNGAGCRKSIRRTTIL